MEDVLYAHRRCDLYDEGLIAKVLNQLRPDNFIYFVISKQFDGNGARFRFSHWEVIRDVQIGAGDLHEYLACVLVLSPALGFGSVCLQDSHPMNRTTHLIITEEISCHPCQFHVIPPLNER